MKKIILKNEDSLRDIWGKMKHNTCFIGVLEEKRKQGIMNLLGEIVTKNFLNLVIEEDTQVQEAQ